MYSYILMDIELPKEVKDLIFHHIDNNSLFEKMDIDLPEEIWSLIFRYLDIKSLQNSQLVCKKWLEIILNDVVLMGEYHISQYDKMKL